MCPRVEKKSTNAEGAPSPRQGGEEKKSVLLSRPFFFFFSLPPFQLFLSNLVNAVVCLRSSPHLPTRATSPPPVFLTTPSSSLPKSLYRTHKNTAKNKSKKKCIFFSSPPSLSFLPPCKKKTTNSAKTPRPRSRRTAASSAPPRRSCKGEA